MTDRLSLDNMRRELGQTWIIVLFGLAYLGTAIVLVARLAFGGKRNEST